MSEESLIQRLKSKPARYGAQTLCGMTFINETLRDGMYFAEQVQKYEPQLLDAVGQAGYWSVQMGLPLLQAGITAAIGYAATKGVGMFMDRHTPELDATK